MKVKDLIDYLSKFDEDMQVMGLNDEFSTYHSIKEPKLVDLVKGNMLFSDDGENWVEDDGMLCTFLDEEPVKITDRIKAIRIF
jgi:hypothetical protein